ncbi:MAG: hypothetical protein GX142_00855 [Chloroflexi bacterium]|nr:hypothetical protein [Chloroflexota bacterium]
MFNLTFFSRNFSAQPPLPGVHQVKKLSWSIEGGPDEALIITHTSPQHLFNLLSILRFPIIISDCFSNPVWWGYISTIEVFFQQVKFTLSLENLFNKVKVVYSMLSPNNHPSAALSETPFTHATLSQTEYGIKERVLFRQGIDDDYALALRDTFLHQCSKPHAMLNPHNLTDPPRIHLTAKGWFHTLGWRFCQNLNGYWANHGPGPGIQAVCDGTTTAVAQRFRYFGTNIPRLKHVYFRLRSVGAPAYNLQARLYSYSSGNPDATLETSASVDASTLSNYTYNWIKFTFPGTTSFTDAVSYWVGLMGSASNATNYILMKTDEHISFSQPDLNAKRYSPNAWKFLTPSVEANARPDLYFRAVFIEDSGQTLQALSTATGEFFTHIQTLSTDVESSPYRDHGLTTLEEIRKLMKHGTANQRLVLASVDSNRRLKYNEAPDPLKPTALMDPRGRFYTLTHQPIPAWNPPIGQYIILVGADGFNPPFDLHQTPLFFLDKFVYRGVS